MKKGFSLIEVLLVIAIAAIIFSISSPLAINFYRNQLVEEARSNVINALENARHNAILQKNDSNFGVRFVEGSYIIFQGDSYNLRNPDFDLILPMINGIDLTGNPDIIYSKLTGEVNATGTISFTFGSISKSIVITDNGTVSKLEVNSTSTPSSAYTVIYNDNGADSGGVPTDPTEYENGGTVTVLDNVNLVKSGYYFNGWNTQADGGGSTYSADDTLLINGSGIILYAVWTDTLISYWSFDGNADDSVSGNNGVLSYGTALAAGTKGLTNTAYYFDGADDMIEVTTTNNIPTTGPRTFVAWIKYNSADTPAWGNIMTIGGGNLCTQSSIFPFGVDINTNIINYGRHCGYTPNTPLTASGLGNSEWHMLTTGYDGTNFFIYVDGNLLTSTPGSDYTYLKDFIRFGSVHTSIGVYAYKGFIDEVRIYNTGLTADEINNLYDAEKPLTPNTPTIGTATVGNAQAIVSYTAPAVNGGSAITSYTVTSSPGGISTTTASTTGAIVTGLTNGTAYTFTVTATNAIGASAASSASNSVTPAVVSTLGTGLVSHFTMNDSAASTVVVDSKGGYNGASARNTSLMSTSGVVGNALSFNGSSDYINLGNGSNVNFAVGSGSWSYSVWTKQSVSTPATVFTKGCSATGSASPWAFVFDENGAGTNLADLLISFGGSPWNRALLVPKPALNTWAHWSFVKDGDNMRIYKNGVYLLSPTDFTHTYLGPNYYTLTGMNAMAWNSPCNAYMGEFGDYNATWLNGALDDVRIYNRAITADEAVQLYNGGAGTEVE